MHCEGTGLQKLQTPSSKALASAFSEPPRPSSELASVLLSLNCLAVNAWTHESWEEIVGGDGLSSLPSILSPFISVFSRAGAGDRGRGAFLSYAGSQPASKRSCDKSQPLLSWLHSLPTHAGNGPRTPVVLLCGRFQKGLGWQVERKTVSMTCRR